MLARNLNLFIHRLFDGYLKIKSYKPGGIKMAIYLMVIGAAQWYWNLVIMS